MLSCVELVPVACGVPGQEILSDTPIAVVQGARQVGKSTLVQEVLARRPGWYVSLDDALLRAAPQWQIRSPSSSSSPLVAWASTRCSVLPSSSSP